MSTKVEPPAAHESYQAMFRAMVWRMLAVSLVPLLMIGASSLWIFRGLSREVALEQHATSLRYHRESVQGFLSGITAELSALAQHYSLAELRAGELERMFRVIEQQPGVLTDIGLIDSDGNHVKYVGPYDLARKN